MSRVKECERLTFEHRHENKSCSVWREWVNDRVREWLLSMDMKKKLFSMSKVSNWESERMREWESGTFKYRRENKSCSACWECVNDRLKECDFESVTFEHRHKTKVVQHVSRIIFNVFKFSKFSITSKLWNSWFPAPVWLSDIFYYYFKTCWWRLDRVYYSNANCKLNDVWDGGRIIPGGHCRYFGFGALLFLAISHTCSAPIVMESEPGMWDNI